MHQVEGNSNRGSLCRIHFKLIRLSRFPLILSFNLKDRLNTKGHVWPDFKTPQKRWAKNTPLCVVLSSLFPAFGYVVRHSLLELIYYFKFKECSLYLYLSFFSIIHLYVDSDIFSDNLPNAPYKWERIALILIHLNRYNIYILGILQPKIRFNITNI